MTPGMHVVLFSPIPYNFLHQRPQKIAEHLVSSGMNATYVEPSPWRDFFGGRKQGLAKAVARSLKYHLFPGGGDSRMRHGGRSTKFTVIAQPLIAPINKIDSSFVDNFTAQALRRFLEREILSLTGNEQTVAVVEHPFWGAVLGKSDFRRIFYDCIDDLTVFVGRNSRERYDDYERRLIGMSTAVFVTAGALEERICRMAGSLPVIRVPNGVDGEWFADRASSQQRPPELDSIKGRIVGYVGTLSSWLDYDMLESVVRRTPDVSFVFVGPVENHARVRNLFSLPHCYWLPRQPYDRIPSYIGAFDICMIPFRSGDISRTTNPIKIFEYFALGKPVVTTPLEDLVRYKDTGLVYWVKNADEFIEAIHQALAEPEGEKSDLRKNVARENSWKSRIDSMLSFMTEQQRNVHI